MDLRIPTAQFSKRKLSEMQTGESFFLMENSDIIFSVDGKDIPLAWHIANENLGFDLPDNKKLCVSADGQSILGRLKNRLVCPMPSELSLSLEGLPKNRISGKLPSGSYITYDESGWIILKGPSIKEETHNILIFNETTGSFLKIDEDITVPSHLRRYFLLKA